jgi:hypothetical protein
MAAPLITIAAILGVALVYVLLPIVADVFVRVRGRRTVGCVETGLVAEVKLDARHAALTAIPGPPALRVKDCSLWPERAGCAQECVAQAAAE